MTLALLFVVKILDNIIMTIRTIAIYKGQKVFTTFFNYYFSTYVLLYH